jgi:bifunctional UDP-N-acetylglucosamine pyrophosphorylase/glucosamine-1-phosphate N-acetyltransferase
MLRGTSRVGAGSVIGPHTTLIDSEVGEHARVPHAFLEQVTLPDRATVEPFTYMKR